MLLIYRKGVVMKMKIRSVLLGAQVVGQASVFALQRTACRTEKITASVSTAGAVVLFLVVKQSVLCRFRLYGNHLCSISKVTRCDALPNISFSRDFMSYA